MSAFLLRLSVASRTGCSLRVPSIKPLSLIPKLDRTPLRNKLRQFSTTTGSSSSGQPSLFSNRSLKWLLAAGGVGSVCLYTATSNSEKVLATSANDNGVPGVPGVPGRSTNPVIYKLQSKEYEPFRNIFIMNVAVFLAWTAAASLKVGGNARALAFMERHFLVSEANFAARRYHTLFTHTISHAGFLHFAANMYALSLLTTDIVPVWDPLEFYKVYFLGGAGAAVLVRFIQQKVMQSTSPLLTRGLVGIYRTKLLSRSTVGSLGASGSVLVFMALWALYNPQRRLSFIFYPSLVLTVEDVLKATVAFDVFLTFFPFYRFSNGFLSFLARIDSVDHLMGVGLGLLYFQMIKGPLGQTLYNLKDQCARTFYFPFLPETVLLHEIELVREKLRKASDRHKQVASARWPVSRVVKNAEDVRIHRQVKRLVAKYDYLVALHRDRLKRSG